MSEPESYASVWDAIADTPEEAANLRVRAALMQKIGTRLKKHDWTQAEAASRCGVTQPRIDDLIRGRVSRSRWTRWSTSRRRWAAARGHRLHALHRGGAQAAKQLSATYFWPFQSHASMSPSCTVADVRDTGTSLWSSTQNAFGLRANLAKV